MEVETVAEIVVPVFKQGMGKKGAWSLAQIVTDKGKSVNVFNPVVVGDKVELTYNAQYKNYSGSVVREKAVRQSANGDIMAKLDEIVAQNNKILSLLDNNKPSASNSTYDTFYEPLPEPPEGLPY